MLHLRRDDLEWRVVSGETVLLDFRDGGRYLSLNATGTVLVSLLAAGTTSEALADRLVERYGVAREQAEMDVDAFVAWLREQQLLVADDAA